jgi:hypothetical protein
MKILTIGDVHGRDHWKFYTHGSSYEYNLWKISISHGAAPDDEFWKELPYFTFDKIIFVGDYVDSYDIDNIRIKDNLLEIIEFKKLLPDKVVLLIGNHDVQYIVPKQICSGFRPEIAIDLEQIYSENDRLFKLAHQEIGAAGDKWLWTHAGVTSGWFEHLERVLKDPKNRFRMFIDEFYKWAEEENEPRTIAEILNFAWDMKFASLFNVDSYSGGTSEWAGPVWVRPPLFTYWPLKGYNQVVGHTPQRKLWIVDDDPDKIPFDGFKIYFVDFMANIEVEPFVIDI